jgi:hypothetical protein
MSRASAVPFARTVDWPELDHVPHLVLQPGRDRGRVERHPVRVGEVEREPEPLGVERLRALDIRHRHLRHLECSPHPVHRPLRRPAA